jgi:hypothetical protein
MSALVGSHTYGETKTFVYEKYFLYGQNLIPFSRHISFNVVDDALRSSVASCKVIVVANFQICSLVMVNTSMTLLRI